VREVEELVARFLELREEEPDLEPADFARRHPEQATELLAALEHLLATLERFEPLRDPAQGPTGGRARRVGDWELLAELGRGGMGVVYEARRADGDEDERVALKLLPLGGLFGERAQERFRREVRTLERLDHPQIVGVREFGSEGDSPYLVMDLVDGRPLSEGVERWRDAREVARLIASLARVVQAAHDGGVLHRDLKPQNVIVSPEGLPVLLDFGLVHALDEATLTSTGDLLGTPRYMAPEQARGEAASERSDVFALGLLLYELLAGRPAYPQEDRSAVLEAAGRAAMPDPARLRPPLPRELVGVLRRALAWRARRRYATAGALAADLERFARGEPVAERGPSLPARALDTLARRPLRFVLGGLLAALALTLVVTVVLPAADARRVARARDIERGFDRALSGHLRGRGELGRRLVEELRERAPEHSPALALEAVLRGAPPPAELAPCEARLLEGMRQEARGEALAARALYREALEHDPRSAWAAALLASLAWELEQPEQAEAELVAASQRLPESLAIAQELARHLFRRGEHARAEREYERALSLDDAVPELWQGLALARLRLGRDDAALEASRRALELAGELEPALANTLATSLDRGGRHAEAQAIFRRLATEHPERTDYAFNLAFSLDSEARVREAAPLYEQVLERDPGHVQATVCLAWLCATTEVEELRDEARAEALVLEALELDRGASPQLVQGAEQVARATGRVERIAELLGRLADEGEVDERSVRLSRVHRSLMELAAESR